MASGGFRINMLWLSANNGLVCFAVNELRRKMLAACSGLTFSKEAEEVLKITNHLRICRGSEWFNVWFSVFPRAPLWLIANCTLSRINIPLSQIHLSFTNPRNVFQSCMLSCTDALLSVCFSAEQTGSQIVQKASQIRCRSDGEAWFVTINYCHLSH